MSVSSSNEAPPPHHTNSYKLSPSRESAVSVPPALAGSVVLWFLTTPLTTPCSATPTPRESDAIACMPKPYISAHLTSLLASFALILKKESHRQIDRIKLVQNGLRNVVTKVLRNHGDCLLTKYCSGSSHFKGLWSAFSPEGKLMSYCPILLQAYLSLCF